MAEQTAAEAKEQYIKAMGDALGVQYFQLWQEIAGLHINWAEFLELFGTKTSRIDLMNRSAGHFFRMVQDSLWETIVLHIARLTDPSQSPGGKDRLNLTLHNLPALTPDATLKDKVVALGKVATDSTAFARDWRNRHIAHRDLDLALGKTAKPLPAVPIAQVKEALDSFEKIMNAVALPYLNSTTSFKHGSIIHGALELIYLLDDGLTLQEERRKKLLETDYMTDPWPIRDL
ncbi:hypothetical protein IVB41_16080 [Bradyrhizobium sp. 44]|uniref:AbiU2 domain-containing protein n=1 Tax=Bradyrhizobium sp. 44 TaxID=2782675 RepID=UPI001FF937DD|nr:hypothetical protein [Bradyrhizobium sp. 44]MCK1285438.1 hypothetical protein [Bradyrhizobium sp. 44]